MKTPSILRKVTAYFSILSLALAAPLQAAESNKHNNKAPNHQEQTTQKDDEHAKTAAAVAATGTAVATGIAASTMSGAAMMSTAATIGCGSAAVGIGVVATAPIAVGAAVYFAWKWATH